MNPCDRIILWGVPRCHLFNSVRRSSFTAWNGPHKVDYPGHKFTTCYKDEGEGKHVKEIAVVLLIVVFSLYQGALLCLPLIRPTSLHLPLSCLVVSLLVPSSNLCRQENRKSEERKFPNKSLWHKEHLLVYRMHSSLCASSKSLVCLIFVKASQGQVVHLTSGEQPLGRPNHNIQS